MRARTIAWLPKSRLAVGSSSQVLDPESSELFARNLLVPGAGTAEGFQPGCTSHQNDVENAEREFCHMRLGDIGHALCDLCWAQRFEPIATENNASAERREQAKQSAEQRRFTGPIRTQKAQHLARFEGQRYIASNNVTAVANGEVVCLQAHAVMGD
jgi:hypothetical protein